MAILFFYNNIKEQWATKTFLQMGVLRIMFGDKFIKKFILLSLFITLPAQTITMSSWPSFLSMKSNVSQFHPAIGKIFKEYTTVGAIVLAGCVITFLGIRHFEKKKAKKREQEEQNRKKEEEKLGREKLKQVDWQEVERDRVMQAVATGEAEKAKKVERNAAIIAERKDEAEVVDLHEPGASIVSAAENRIEEESERSDLSDFDAIDQQDIEVSCSQLTHGYLNALFNKDTSLQDYIIQVNNYSSEDRMKLAKALVHGIDAVNGDEVRAFEYIKSGYENLASILNDNFDGVPGYDQVVRMSDGQAAVLQSAKKAKIRKNYLNSIVSVIWCLYDCALRTGDAFTQGAFNAKSKNLYDFFLRYITFVNPDYKQMGLFGGNCNNPYAYKRVSSHLKYLAKKRKKPYL